MQQPRPRSKGQDPRVRRRRRCVKRKRIRPLYVPERSSSCRVLRVRRRREQVRANSQSSDGRKRPWRMVSGLSLGMEGLVPGGGGQGLSWGDQGSSRVPTLLLCLHLLGEGTA